MFCVGVLHIYGPKVRPVFGETVVVCVALLVFLGYTVLRFDQSLVRR